MHTHTHITQVDGMQHRAGSEERNGMLAICLPESCSCRCSALLVCQLVRLSDRAVQRNLHGTEVLVPAGGSPAGMFQDGSVLRDGDRPCTAPVSTYTSIRPRPDVSRGYPRSGMGGGPWRE